MNGRELPSPSADGGKGDVPIETIVVIVGGLLALTIMWLVQVLGGSTVQTIPTRGG